VRNTDTTEREKLVYICLLMIH